MKYRRVTIFAGHYGSGKTNIAVNYAIKMRGEKEKVVIADLDIVNPYFRTKDSADKLEKNGIRLISSQYANTNVDLPALPQEMYGVTDDKSEYAVLDIGGDDRGAYALGRYAQAIQDENDYEMLFVINKFRPLTSNVSDTLQVMREIEQACSMKFTAIVNNSNLGEETTAEDVINSHLYAKEIAQATGLEIKFTAVKADLYEKMPADMGEILPLYLQKKIN